MNKVTDSITFLALKLLVMKVILFFKLIWIRLAYWYRVGKIRIELGSRLVYIYTLLYAYASSLHGVRRWLDHQTRRKYEKIRICEITGDSRIILYRCDWDFYMSLSIWIEGRWMDFEESTHHV